MNKEQTFQTLDSLVYAMEKLENESTRSEGSEELEQVLALMNKGWHELYTVYGKYGKNIGEASLKSKRKRNLLLTTENF